MLKQHVYSISSTDGSSQGYNPLQGFKKVSAPITKPGAAERSALGPLGVKGPPGPGAMAATGGDMSKCVACDKILT